MGELREYRNKAGDFELEASLDGHLHIKFRHNDAVTSEIAAYGDQEQNLRSLHFLISEAIRQFNQYRDNK